MRTRYLKRTRHGAPRHRLELAPAKRQPQGSALSTKTITFHEDSQALGFSGFKYREPRCHLENGFCSTVISEHRPGMGTETAPSHSNFAAGSRNAGQGGAAIPSRDTVKWKTSQLQTGSRPALQPGGLGTAPAMGSFQKPAHGVAACSAAYWASGRAAGQLRTCSPHTAAVPVR